MTRNDLYGFVPAAVTPFNELGEIQFNSFGIIVDWLIGLGATAICVGGDNGESWALDAAERSDLVSMAVDVSNGRVPIISGCSAPTLDTCIKYAQAGENAGASALLMMPPTYVLKGAKEEIIQRFKGVSKETNLPLIAYNSPRRVGYSLSMDDLEAIMEVVDLIGIKESHRDFFHHTHLIRRFGQRMSVMVGPCHYILPAMALGARGYIATGPEFLGDNAARIAELVKTAPNADYVATHNKLTDIYETLMAIGTWPSSFKAALNLIGQPAGVPRDPVLPVNPEQLEKLKKLVHSQAST
ncbi:MAG: dihydrodipicolinate synthase family protein [Cohaesibacteraceae bacterium]|nr:dihydrodipicolinate synthase family protein [Cohaesibacteraceae bacterium]MBL4875855.1 dihydrodipicolinate synthase family protein [Cohaesibacteraceae bacterium]